MSGLGDPARRDLDERILEWMAEEPNVYAGVPDEARFDTLALELFAFQFRRCPPFARFCQRRGVTPENVTSWRSIPAVPTGAFKELSLRSFPGEAVSHVFRTSGTTGGRRGELLLDTLALYEASLLASFRRHLLPDLARLGGKIPMRILAPSPEELPDSSLSHMFGLAVEHWGAPGSGFDVTEGVLDSEALRSALGKLAADGRPILLAGTAFAFLHLLEILGADELGLPLGSRLMETGGFKGFARSVPREQLHARLGTTFAVAPQQIVNQYGMCELGSQFYDSCLSRPGEPRRKLSPPWARVRIVDPESGAEVEDGASGMILVVDLANTGSVLAVQTADLGHRVDDGFEIESRDPRAEAKGCSIAADLMLTGGPT